MARENLAFLTGVVKNDPEIKTDKNAYAFVYVIVARSAREVGDHRKYMKCDNIIIMTRDETWIEEIKTWKQYDTVDIKGMIASKNIKKSSFCSECNTKNSQLGALVYINPIYCEKRGHVEDMNAALKFLADHREISNQILAFGHLCRDPKLIRPKDNLVVTQYQVALTRKFRIRTDAPEIRTDFPWVKSYGSNAEEDCYRLHVGSEVYIDGCLQARSVRRHAICGQEIGPDGKPLFDEAGDPIMRKDQAGKPCGCGAAYDWKDRAMEIVPYETEYISNYNDDDTIEEIKRKRKEQSLRDTEAGKTDPTAPNAADYAAGYDDMKADE